MQKSEMITVLERLEEYYRNFYAGTDRERVLDAWYPMFKHDSADEVNRAVVTYICTEKFAPTVSGIKGIMAENRMAGQMTEMQAWGKIRRAIDEANDRHSAAEAFAKLPPILQNLVCEPARLRAWRSCSDDTLEGVIASNVMRSYRELAKREAVWYTIPGQLQVEQRWRVDVQDQIALPEPETYRSIEQIIEDANTGAAEHGMIMTDDLREKHSGRLGAFLTPMTENERLLFEAKEKKKEADRLERMRV